MFTSGTWQSIECNWKFHPQPPPVQHPPKRLVCSYEISVGATVASCAYSYRLCRCCIESKPAKSAASAPYCRFWGALGDMNTTRFHSLLFAALSLGSCSRDATPSAGTDAISVGGATISLPAPDGFFRYDEPSSERINNYTAHAVLGTVTVVFQ